MNYRRPSLSKSARKNRPTWSRTFFRVPVAAISLLFAGHSAQAVTYTWSGATSTDWAALNGFTTIPTTGGSLVFGADGAAGAAASDTLTNTLTSTAFNIAGITFNAGAPAYTMTGNTFTLTAGITNNSSNLQTFTNTGITGTAVTPTSTAGLTTNVATTWVPGTAGISLNGLQFTETSTSGVTTTVNGAGTTLTIGFLGLDIGSTSRVVQNFNGSGNITVTGNVNEGGATSGINTYSYSGTGTLTINGTFVTTTSVDDTVSSGTLVIGGSEQTNITATGTGNFTETSAGALSSANTFAWSSTGTAALGGTNTYTGATAISAGTVNLTGKLGATAITVSGGTFNESGAGVLNTGATLTTTGGTTTLSGTNLYTGFTTVNGGTLLLDYSATGASTTNIINSGSTLVLGGGTLTIKGNNGASNTQAFFATNLTANTSSEFSFNQNGATGLSATLGAVTRGAGSTIDFTLPTTGTVSTTSKTFSTNGVFVSAATNGIAFATVNGGAAFAALNTTTGAISALAPVAGTYGATANVSVGTSDAPASGLGANTLTFNGVADTVAFTGTNAITTGGILVTPSATGASAISGGTLTAGGGKELVISNYEPTASGSLTISSLIADNATASALTAAGPGLTILTNANTYTGNTTITGTGNLRLGNANAVQDSTLFFGGSASAGLSFSSGIGTFNVGGLGNATYGSDLLTLTDASGAGVNLQVGSNNVSSADFLSGINGLGTLTKIGTGTLTLNGGNNITVPVVVNAGTVFSQGTLPLQNVPSLTINNGGVVYYQRGSVGIANGAATDSVTINSGGILSSDYVSGGGSQDTGLGALTLNGGNLVTRNQPTSGQIFYDRGTFGLGIATVAGSAAVTAGGGVNPTSTISAVNVGLRETGGTVFNVLAGSGAGGSASGTPGGVDLLFSGTILSRTNNNNTTLIKQGNGVMELTGANAFITPVQVSAGILQINSIANGGVQTTTSAASATSTSVTVTSATGIAAGQAVGFSSSSNTINAGTTVGSGYTAGSTTVPLAIPTNTTDTGTATVASGFALTFGFANPLGISTNAASNLIIDGGTLQYVGAAGSTDRLFQVGIATAGSTSTVDSSGTGALSFTNTGALTYGTTAQTRTLALSGSNTGANTFAPIIGNNGTAAVSLNKTGAGSWTLTGNNTYTGATTVSGGTLTAAGTGTNKALGGTTSIAVNNGGTLLFGVTNQASTAAAITLGTTAAQTPASTTGILSFAAGASQGTGATSMGGTVSGAMTTGGTTMGTTTAGLGALTLSNTATLAFGGANTTLVFGTFMPNGNVLNITGYTNTGAQTAGNSGMAGDDRLIFSTDQAANLADFNFGAGAGVGVSEVALDGTFFEITNITPVPEPSTWVGCLLLVAGAGWTYRRRRAVS